MRTCHDYDGEGLRFALIENGKRTEFITNGWENLAELDEDGKVVKRVIRGMGIAASEDFDGQPGEGGAYHYYHGNERSDVELITDENGSVANRYSYDAFGTITDSEEAIANRYTYNGEAYDQITGQYYLRKRFYNPAVCRFTQEDEYRGDGLNLYAFCANNPVTYVDPSGYEKGDNDITMTTAGDNDAFRQQYEVLGQSYNKVDVTGTVYSRGQVRTIDRTVYQRNDIDWDYVSSSPFNSKGLSNRELAHMGRVPFGSDDMWIELHHLTQNEPGTMIELFGSTLDKYSKQLHGMVEAGGGFRNDPDLNAQYGKFREEYWKERIKEVEAGEALEKKSKCAAK